MVARLITKAGKAAFTRLFRRAFRYALPRALRRPIACKNSRLCWRNPLHPVADTAERRYAGTARLNAGRAAVSDEPFAPEPASYHASSCNFDGDGRAPVAARRQRRVVRHRSWCRTRLSENNGSAILSRSDGQVTSGSSTKQHIRTPVKRAPATLLFAAGKRGRLVKPFSQSQLFDGAFAHRLLTAVNVFHRVAGPGSSTFSSIWRSLYKG